ncbi:MAG: hypothetical protein ABSF64_06770 [Bryobacteraceae bacterium]|jgi:hypothetical protein
MSTRKSVFSMLAMAAGLLSLSSIPPARAQEKPAQAQPQLVTFWGVASNSDGKPKAGVAGVTFSLFKEEQGGAPLWMETQNVNLDSAGGYTAQIGATHPEGLPIDLFASGQARWLEVRIDGQPAPQRVLLMSVPYALQAVDAQTLGGLPASAFALAGTGGGAAGNAAGGASIASAKAVAAPDAARPAAAPSASVSGAGTAGYLPVWTGSATLANSAITQKSGDVGIGGVVSGTKFAVSNASGDGIYGATDSATGHGVYGEATAAAASNTVGVYGVNSGTAGMTWGVFGQTGSAPGAVQSGVQGNAIATTGSTFGVDGTAASVAGIGVQGHAEAATGATIGVNGISDSDAGIGTQGIATATTGTTFGVFGNSVSSSGYGVQGYASATTGTTFGVYGVADSTLGTGVWGEASATTGATFGVVGSAPSSSGVGVLGQSNAASGSTYGVSGSVVSPSGIGVAGNAAAPTGTTYGVLGSTESSSGTGVRGQAVATNGTTYGVYGKNFSSTGVGVEGLNTATTGINYGVVGTSASTQGVGVYGYGSAQSTLGGQLAGDAAGVWGDTHNGSAGVFATADSAEAIAAYNNAPNVATLFVENQEDTNSSSIVVATYSDYGGYCDIFVNGNLTCSGSVGGHAFVGPDTSREVALYAVQAPENWYEDAGSGQLHNGAAVVALDAAYAQTVNTGVEYHVFLTPKGDCKGLYVGNETSGGFEVHELGGGTSGIAFDYRIMARRKGFENIRLADLTGKIQRGPDLKSANGPRSERVMPGAAPDVAQLPTVRPAPRAARRPALTTSPGH